MTKSAEGRIINSDGPSVQQSSNDYKIGGQGLNVRSERVVTPDDEVTVCKTTSDGTYSISGDRSVVITGGGKGKEGDVDIMISGVNGDISITCMNNGIVRIKAAKIELSSDNDIDIKAKQNVNISAGTAIMMEGNKINAEGLSGNIIESVGKSLYQQITKGLNIANKRKEKVNSLLSVDVDGSV